MLYVQCGVSVPLKTIIFLSRNSEEYGVEMEEGLYVLYSGFLKTFSGDFYLQVSDRVMHCLHMYSVLPVLHEQNIYISHQFSVTCKGVIFQLQGQMFRWPCVSSQFAL